MQDALLRSLLESACIRDIALERFLTNARGVLLEAAISGGPADEDTVAFACALARQCFINEYAFDCTDAELAQVERLRDGAGERYRAPAARRACGLRSRCTRLPMRERACSTAPGPTPSAALLDLQVRAPLEERADPRNHPRADAGHRRRVAESARAVRAKSLSALDQDRADRARRRRSTPIWRSFANFRALDGGVAGRPDRGLRHRAACRDRGAAVHRPEHSRDRSQPREPRLRAARDASRSA